MKEARPETGNTPESHAPEPVRDLAEQAVVTPDEAVRTCDTATEIDAYLTEGYRRMSPGEKMARVRALNRAVILLATADVRRTHPHAGEREIALRVAARWLDAETMRRAFGWDPKERT